MSHPHLSFTVFSAEARLACLGSCSILVTWSPILDFLCKFLSVSSLTLMVLLLFRTATDLTPFLHDAKGNTVL